VTGQSLSLKRHSRGTSGPPFDERSSLLSMDHVTASLAPERQVFRRAHVQHVSTRDQLVHPREKRIEKRGRVCPVVADHQIDGRYFAFNGRLTTDGGSKFCAYSGNRARPRVETIIETAIEILSTSWSGVRSSLVRAA
jgi:hypothetical protein